MIGGIDQQIQQKVDAYRGNPQQLMQRYQQNQELIDLLALQKLKSEKDAAARQMQMQMQGNPQTIKDQREAEMLQRTKDDMVKQTSGIMQQRQQQQQKNMQRTANQGLPQLPAGNMQRMAGGGIVAFAEGGSLQQKDVDAQLRQMIDAALELGESPEALAERLKDNPNALAILRSATQKAPQERMLGTPTRDQARQADQSRLERIRGNLSPSLGSIDTEQLVRGMGVTPLSEKPQSAGIAGMLPERSGVIDPVQRRKEREAALAARDQQAEGIMAQREQQRQQTYESSPLGGRLFVDNRQESAQRAQQEATPPSRERGGYTEEMGRQLTEAYAGLAEADREAAAEQKRAQQMGQLQEIDTSGLSGLKKESMTPREMYEGYKSALGSAVSEQQDPEKLARERQRAFRLGALSGGGRGGLAGAAAASGRAREAQEARKLQGIEKLMGAENLLMGADADAAKLEVERESNKILNQIRQGQLTSQQMDSIRRTINDITESVMDSLTFDETYNGLQTRYQEAINDGNLETAKLVKQEMDTYLNSKLEAYPTYKAAMEEFKQLQTAQTGGASSGWGKPQIVAE